METYEDFYDQGLYYVATNDLDKAKEMFLKCISVDSKNVEAYYQIMLVTLRLEEYNDLKKYLDELKENEMIDINSYNYYLYLSDFITYNVSFDKALQEKDILVSNDTINSDKRNKIRKEAFQKHFRDACKLSDDLYNESDNLENLLEKRLLYCALNKKYDKKSFFKDNIAIKRYEAIVERITGLEKINKSTKDDLLLKKLALIYLKLESGELLEYDHKFKKYNSIYEAIEHNDFRVALKFSGEFNEKNNIDRDDNPVTLALRDICFLTKRMKYEKIANNKLKENNMFNKTIADAHHKMLSKRGAVIIDTEYDPNVFDILSVYHDNKAFVIEDENGDKKIVVAYKGSNKIDIKLADTLYEKKKYALAIREYIKVIESDCDFPSYIYYRIGLSYLNLNDKETALTYFRIANDVFVNDIEIEKLISELSNVKSQSEVKV